MGRKAVLSIRSGAMEQSGDALKLLEARCVLFALLRAQPLSLHYLVDHVLSEASAKDGLFMELQTGVFSNLFF